MMLKIYDIVVDPVQIVDLILVLLSMLYDIDLVLDLLDIDVIVVVISCCY